MHQKVTVMMQSLTKLEHLAYRIKIRQLEFGDESSDQIMEMLKRDLSERRAGQDAGFSEDWKERTVHYDERINKNECLESLRVSFSLQEKSSNVSRLKYWSVVHTEVAEKLNTAFFTHSLA